MSILTSMILKMLELDESNLIEINDTENYNIKDFLEMSNSDIMKENGGKKFDICLMNPPYANGLHEKFLLKTIDISDKIISIQPSNFLFGNRKNTKIIDKVRTCYFDVEQFTNKTFIMDATLGNDLGIFYINQSKKSEFILNDKSSNLDNLSKFIGDELIKTFNKIIEPLYSKNNVVNHLKKYNGEISGNWYVKIPKIRGHKYNGIDPDFYTLISNNEDFILKDTIGQLDNVQQGKRSKLDIYLEFDTKEEAHNFINYCKTDFFRTSFYLLKISQNVISGKILRKCPWFDFSDSHFNQEPKKIDDWLFKKYNISDDIRKHIEEILPDYYGIR